MTRIAFLVIGIGASTLATRAPGQVGRPAPPHGETNVNEVDHPPKSALATFGTGCFWCTEAVFEQLKGVTNVVSGYSGGTLPSPTYQQVSSGTTGHAEVIQITFDPAQVSFDELLEVFWRVHDPTTLNRQGADIGTQYRSVIFYHDESQREIAEGQRRSVDRSGEFNRPIVTEIAPYAEFYPAENYHQDYFRLNGRQPYCSTVIRPKLRKFRQEFRDRLKSE